MSSEFDSLNVGCGLQGTGDVNCDLSLRDPDGHRSGDVVDLRFTRNFVVCDGQYLPFKDNVFRSVYSAHAIEHVKDPFLMLRELVRVSRKRVVVVCPHRWHALYYFRNYWWRRKHHVSHLNKTWFYTAANALNCYARVVYSEMSIILSLPNELTAVLQRKDWRQLND